MTDRNEDQKFIATYGRDSTFTDGLRGVLDGSDDLLSTWFVVTQLWAKKEPQKMRGYRIVFSFKRANASDPSTGYRAAFFSESQFDESAKVQDPKKAALIIQQFPVGANSWRFLFPSDDYVEHALAALVDHFTAHRLKGHKTFEWNVR